MCIMALILGDSMYGVMSEKRIAALKVGREYRIPFEALQEFVQATLE